MHLKRPIVYTLLFIALVLLGDRLFSYLLDTAVLQCNTRFSRLYTGRASADIVILGNSRGNRSFHAPSMQKSLGKSVINISYNALSTEVAQAILDDYIEHNGKPELVIVEVSGITMTPEAMNDLKLYTSVSPRLAEIYRREQPAAYYSAQVMHLFRLNGVVALQSLRNYHAGDQGTIFRNRMGPNLIELVEAESEVKFPEHGMERLKPEEKAACRQRNLEALEKIVATAHREGIELRLVVAPYWPRYREKMEDWDDIMAQIRRHIGDEPLWDYSLALSEPTDFGDRVHLNLDGANKLVAQMQSDGLFDPGAKPMPRTTTLGSK